MAEDDMVSKRIYGALYGNCIGDAIGLLTEFMVKSEATTYYNPKGLDIKKDPNFQLEYEQKVPDFHRSRWLCGDWTDDSDQMILMMQSITDKAGTVDPADYGNKVLNWARHGFPELGDYAGMGLGATTHHVLKHKSYKTDPHFAARDIWEKSGRFAAPNGAVMRTSVMGIYQYTDMDRVIKNTLDFCKVTHADFRCQASCVAVTTAIAMMLQGKHFNESKKSFDIDKLIEESYQIAMKIIPDDCENAKEYRKELKRHMMVKKVKELHLDESGKIGYTYKTLGAGFWALRQDDFRYALQRIVMEAGDADTNGAVAGALLGCKLGQEGLPGTWYNKLVHKKWLDDIIGKFLELPTFNPPYTSPAATGGVAEEEKPKAAENVVNQNERSDEGRPSTAGSDKKEDDSHVAKDATTNESSEAGDSNPLTKPESPEPPTEGVVKEEAKLQNPENEADTEHTIVDEIK